MTDAPNVSTAPGSRAPNWLISMFLMLAMLVANGVLIVGLLQMLTWTECVLLVLTGISLSCGLLYTIVAMQKLGKHE
jgi:hypothetical protein